MGLSGTVAYFGPAGTFAHQAAGVLAPNVQLLALSDIAQVVAAVESDRCGGGVVPFENSVEGEVSSSIDALVLNTEHAVIAAETILAVSFTLFRLPDDDAPLAGVASYPVALAQCTRFCADKQLRTTASTADACVWLADSRQPGWGALAAPGAGANYGLRTAAEGLEDEPGAVTRFVLLAKEGPPPSGRDRTAFAVRPRSDQPGSLVRILQEFSLRHINLTTVTSRPVKGALGDYYFFIECEGHLLDPGVRDAIVGVLGLPSDVRYLGSFPEADSRPTRSRHDDDAQARRTYDELAASVAKEA